MLSHNIILLVESYKHYLKIYYADGHSEIFEQTIQGYLKNKPELKGYKNPIIIDSTELHPTTNISYKECMWVNLNLLEEGNEFFITLLRNKGVLDEVKKLYIRTKRKQIALL